MIQMRDVEGLEKHAYTCVVNIESIFDLIDVADRFTKLDVTKTKIGDILVVTEVSLTKIDITEDIILLAMENKKACDEIIAKINEKRIREENDPMTDEEATEYRRVRLERDIGSTLK